MTRSIDMTLTYYVLLLQEFKAAAAKVRDLAKTPSNEDYASIYSLFKQATEGDCTRGEFYHHHYFK